MARYWFKPKPDITAAELAEIFQATFMSLSLEYWAKLTAEAQRHFEEGPESAAVQIIKVQK